MKNGIQDFAGANPMRILALTLVILFIPFAANATDVRLIGFASWYIPPSAASVRLTADEVANFDIFTSGTLYLELWAFDTPYNGNAQVGYHVADDFLGQLPAFFSFFNVDDTVPLLVLPPPGFYCPSILLTEYQGPISGYVPVDWINTPCEFFGPTLNVAPVASFTASPITGNAPLTISVNGSGLSRPLLIFSERRLLDSA